MVATAGASKGPCHLFGTTRRASVLDAALINGMACHALDFDISNNPFYGHPAVNILSVAFALGEMLDADGRDLLTAYVVGSQVEFKIARAVQPLHSDLGWFPSGTIGVFGTAATAARLLRLDRDQTARALGVAASFASGVQANAGTMTKSLAAGHAARNGALAAMLAAEGFTGSLNAFEHKEGFLNLFNGVGKYDSAAILRDWGKPFEIPNRQAANRTQEENKRRVLAEEEVRPSRSVHRDEAVSDRAWGVQMGYGRQANELSDGE
jgi:2-methylcitrate dehydratase PrpD